MALAVAARQLAPSELLFGGIWIGPGPDAGQDLGQDNADATVAAAVAAGIAEFDTAPWYGSGAAEERLGKAVAKLPPGTAKIITKAGRMITERDGSPCVSSIDAEEGGCGWRERIVGNDYTAAGAKASLAQSLARMGLPGVHGLRIHDPNDNSSRDEAVDEVAIALREDGMLAGLRELRSEGAIEHVGLGMNCSREAHMGVPDEVVRLIRGAEKGTFDSALLAGGWNLLSQAGLPCLLECQKEGIAVHVAGVFASGLLVGVNRYAYKAAPPEMSAKAERWRALAEKHGSTLPAVAMAFAALPTVVSRVVIGMATAQQVEQTLATVAASAAVPKAIWAEARQEGLLDPAVPLPS